MASEVIERALYNGKYNMVHNPLAKGSSPRYVVNAELRPKGVTTILGETLAKNLTQWAVDMCVTFLREKLPSITEQDLVDGSTAHVRKRDAGGNTGTETHALVEQFLKGNVPEIDNTSKDALKAYLAFVEWFENSGAEVLGVEEVVYSPTLHYAGTYDCILKIDGKVYLCDLKTTNASRNAPKGIYPENFIQLGAYALAHEEQRMYEVVREGTNLVKIDDLMVISAKKDGRLDIQTASDLGLAITDCSEMFAYICLIYKFMQSVSKKLKEVNNG